MTMKRFLLRIIAFFVCISCCVLMINTAYSSCDKTRNRYANMPEKIEVCNFGSSHGVHSFDYEGLNINAFNFAFSSQYPSYDYRLLDEYKDHIAEGATVIIPISYFVFYGKSEELTEDFTAKNSRYYSVLSPNRIKEFSLKEFIKQRFPAVFEKESLLKYIFGYTEIKVDENESNKYKYSSDIDVQKDAEEAYSRHIIKGKFDEQGERIVNNEEIEAVVSMIKLCQEINARPILVTTPYLEEYNILVNKDVQFKNDFKKLVNNIIQRTGVLYLDYSCDERFVKEYDLYFNSDHLNIHGARLFTQIVLQDVGL